MTFQAVKLDALCIVSKPLKERVNILPNGCKYVAQTDNRVEVIFPPGAVENEESVTLHVCIKILIIGFGGCIYFSGNHLQSIEQDFSAVSDFVILP